MRELNSMELGSVSGGRSDEYRTVEFNEIPLVEEPPRASIPEPERPAEGARWRESVPNPLRWLPPRDGRRRVY